MENCFNPSTIRKFPELALHLTVNICLISLYLIVNIFLQALVIFWEKRTQQSYGELMVYFRELYSNIHHLFPFRNNYLSLVLPLLPTVSLFSQVVMIKLHGCFIPTVVSLHIVS